MAKDEVISEIDQAVEQVMQMEGNLSGQEQGVSEQPGNLDSAPGAIFADYDEDENHANSEGDSGEQERAEGERSGDGTNGDVAPDSVQGATGAQDDETEPPGGEASLGEGVEGVTHAGVLYAMKSGMSVADARSFSNDNDLMEAVQIQQALPPEDDEYLSSGDDSSGLQESDLSKLIESLKGEDLDPAVMKVLASIAEEDGNRREQLQELKDAQVQISRDMDQRDMQQREKWFDGQISGLGGEFEEVLGKGASSEMLPMSKEFEVRWKIAETIGVMNDGYTARNLQPPSSDILFDQATRMVLGEKYQAIHDKGVTDGLKKREGQFMSRPSGGMAPNTKAPELETAELLVEKFGVNL